MKRLPPTIRPNYRYLKFKIHSEEEFELGQVVDAFWESILDYMGSKATGEAEPWVIGNKFSEERQGGILKVRREREDDVRASLTLTGTIDGQDCAVEVTGVSGSLEKLE